MIRARMVAALRQEHQVGNREDITCAVDLFFDTISEALGQGCSVNLRDFGTFSIRQRASPTGASFSDITPPPAFAERVVRFKASDALRQVINSKSSPDCRKLELALKALMPPGVLG